MKGYRFKLLQRGYPVESKNWFSYEDAVNFEETVFTNEHEAHELFLTLCDEHGTLGDPNFLDKHPLILTEEAWRITKGDDADIPFSWY